uniref:LO8 n=1 Tax=Swordtail adomavirus 1 TaxID=2609876 RepID=A0A6F9FCU6_9VIRU|nr:TPA_asm: LO8 [Swordtail adomavirus 1]
MSRKIPLRSKSHPYQAHRPMKRDARAGLEINAFTHTSQDVFTGPQGEFVNWGWLSVPEMYTGLCNLLLSEYICTVRVCTSQYCDLPHIPNGKALIFLVRKHYICVAHVCNKLLFFDPLSQPAHTYFGNELPQLAHINLLVQEPNSPFCGNFCLFFLHCVFNRMKRTMYTKNTILDATRLLLQRYLYTAPHPVRFNSTLIEYFTVNHRIGEEFHSAQHERFRRYDNELSVTALHNPCT